MSPEKASTDPKPEAAAAPKTEGTEKVSTPELKVKPGVLRLEDVPADQRNEVVVKHLSEVNAKFRAQGREGDATLIRTEIKEKYGPLDLADLEDIMAHAEAIVAIATKPAQTEKADPKKTETKSTTNKTVATAEDPEKTGNDFSEETDTASESQESPSERQARLQAFVADHFPNCPPEFVNQAAGICLQYEDDYRDMFEEPDLKLSPDDAADPEIGDNIAREIQRFQEETSNAREIETKENQAEEQQENIEDQEQKIKDNQPKVDAAEKQLPTSEKALKDTKEAVKEQSLENKEDDLKRKKSKIEDKNLSLVKGKERSKNKTSVIRESNSKTNLENSEARNDVAIAKNENAESKNDAADSKNETVTEDLKTVKELQSKFNSLKAEKGTIGALKTLLGPDGVQSASMKAIVKRVLGTAQSLVAALPGKSAVVERYLNQSSVDFSASAPAQTFAGFLALVDSSDDFTEEERVQIRQILNSSSPAPAGSAAELKDALKNGRGTKQITEIQRVEEPPGSGNFIEKEVVVGTETIPFTKSKPYVLSNNPLVKLHPVTEGGTKYQVNAIVTNASPINFTVDIPQDKPIPEQAINNQVNQHLLRATLQNANLRGVMDFWYGQGDSTFGAGGETSGASLGGNDMSKAITNMFLGQNTLQGNRFLTTSELGRIAHDARWLVPGGDFGGTNKVAGAESNQMMKALFGEDKTEITDNMARAHFVINSGGAEDPSFEGLYQSMYPEDTDFSRLTDIVGEQAVAALNLNRPKPDQLTA